jgi:translation initiation factor IF-2
VGAITEKDVKLAKDTKSVIVGFRVGTEKTALELGERDKIKMKSFDVIYELSQGVRNLMEKMISPKIARKDMGKVKILVVFRKDKKGQIVGGKVIEGEIIKDNELEILREDAIIGKGKLKSLQKQKKDIERGVKGDEIGILYQGEGQIQEGDILIAFKEELVKPEL